MKILAHLHKFPPVHNAGAEHMALAILKWMVARGHQAQVILPSTGDDAAEGDGIFWEIDGVRVEQTTDPAKFYPDADLVITHLDLTRTAMRFAERAGRPLVHLVHNDRQLRYHHVRPHRAALVVFNSHWLDRAVRWSAPSIVCHPPVFADDYLVKGDGDAVTLINLTVAKGANIFYELARLMPTQRFIGVEGAYGEQVIPDDRPPNVEIWNHEPNARRIYEETRILLMPSGYESFGRCAIEAAVSGIPTLAAPTPGLVEALGPGGTFCDLHNIEHWVAAIDALQDPVAYLAACDRAQEAALRLDPKADLERLEEAFIKTLEWRPGARGSR